ncbi:hypothetical protein WR25_23976 [Diploscapter pachys]|uniref:Uncharacterized protein n=1 Tax=Diploscapter pachys TaxID=2018661 RepID=A0A2A2L7E4_9BILA|nr:hypothetical protein WR25_23976 [Diploscapter pachys]
MTPMTESLISRERSGAHNALEEATISVLAMHHPAGYARIISSNLKNMLKLSRAMTVPQILNKKILKHLPIWQIRMATAMYCQLPASKRNIMQMLLSH